MKKCGIGGKLLDWFENYLQERLQRVVINGQFSLWELIKAGVPQGSVLGPLLFLLYIDDLVETVEHCGIRLFADDTCLFIEVGDRDETAALINSDLNRIYEWSKKWIVSFAPTKTNSLIVSNKRDSHLNPPVFLNHHPVQEVSYQKYLGLTFTNNLRWNRHIDETASKAQRKLNAMLPLKFKLDRKSLEVMYNSFVLPTMEYAIVVWGGTFDSDILKLEKIHINAMRLVTGATSKSNIANLYSDTGWSTFNQRKEQSILAMFYKIKNGQSPEYLQNLLPPDNQDKSTYNLRNKQDVSIPFARLETYKRSFFSNAIRLWNSLPICIRSCQSITEFKTALQHKPDDITVLYYYRERWAQIHHARLRTGCSKLNADLCFNLHVRNDPTCACGHLCENAAHFLFNCPNYAQIRNNMIQKISAITTVSLDTILYGNRHLSQNANYAIFDAVHEYTKDSNRFS